MRKKASVRRTGGIKQLVSDRWALFTALGVRFLSALTLTTEFVPDEAWQATEVAYYYVFGRGHLTWEWLVGLRNHFYPFCIAAIYYLLKMFRADSPSSLLLMPRLFQATITAVGDYAFFLFCERRYGERTAKWGLMLMLSNWFSVYCGSRTITNTTEMALNCIAMYLMEIDQVVFLCGVVSLNFMIRPTALVIWIPQVVEVFRLFFPRKVPHRLPASIWIFLLVVTVLSLIDCVVYRKPVLAFIRFIKFNFLEGQSAIFGQHHYMWYFYNGLPSIVGLSIIPLFLSLCMKKSLNHVREWNIIGGFILGFSFISHKEIRFLLPIVPYMCAVSGNVLAKIEEAAENRTHELCRVVDARRLLKNFTALLLLTNGLAVAYFCGFHQGGVLPATTFVNQNSTSLANPKVWVMTQCYNVPVFTYMHNHNNSFEYITCGPNSTSLRLDELMPNFERYSTKQEELAKFVSEKKGEGVPFPDYVICYDQTLGKLIEIFRSHEAEYQRCFSHLHAQFGDDKGLIHVLCKKKKVDLWF